MFVRGFDFHQVSLQRAFYARGVGYENRELKFVRLGRKDYHRWIGVVGGS